MEPAQAIYGTGGFYIVLVFDVAFWVVNSKLWIVIMIHNLLLLMEKTQCVHYYFMYSPKFIKIKQKYNMEWLLITFLSNSPNFRLATLGPLYSVYLCRLPAQVFVHIAIGCGFQPTSCQYPQLPALLVGYIGPSYAVYLNKLPPRCTHTHII